MQSLIQWDCGGAQESAFLTNSWLIPMLPFSSWYYAYLEQEGERGGRGGSGGSRFAPGGQTVPG